MAPSPTGLAPTEAEKQAQVLAAAALLGGEIDAFLSMVPEALATAIRFDLRRARSGAPTLAPGMGDVARVIFARTILIKGAKPFMALKAGADMGPELARLARLRSTIPRRLLETNVFAVADRLEARDLEPLLEDDERRVREVGLAMLAALGRSRSEAAWRT